MQVCVLGPLLVRDGPNEVASGGPLQRRVLARLAMDGGRPVGPSELEAAVWGDEPSLAARRTIASHVEQADREWTVSHARLIAGGPGGAAAEAPGEVLDPHRAHQLAATLAVESARPAAGPRRRRARG